MRGKKAFFFVFCVVLSILFLESQAESAVSLTLGHRAAPGNPRTLDREKPRAQPSQ
jgi:hypothetical protein